MRVYKYELTLGGEVRIPVGARFLHIDSQDDGIFLWCEVNEDESNMHLHRFVVVPTGGVPPKNATFMRTVLMSGGELVWHVYELRPTSRPPLSSGLKT